LKLCQFALSSYLGDTDLRLVDDLRAAMEGVFDDLAEPVLGFPQLPGQDPLPARLAEFYLWRLGMSRATKPPAYGFTRRPVAETRHNVLKELQPVLVG
jgi:hypothetical protein